MSNQQEVKKITQSFHREFGGRYRLFAAPGRINLIGEHTDYNEGFVLPAAIDKRIYLALAPQDGPSVDLYATDLEARARFNLQDEDASPLPQWARYAFGVVKELQKLGYQPGGFRAAFGGDIPTGAGLSSSAALESVFAWALNHVFDLGADSLTLARVGQSAEHNYAGVRCGIMDQFASVFGKKDRVIRLDCRSLDHELFPLRLDGHELVLADTGVKHSLAASAYNERREQCEAGVAAVAQRHPWVKSLRDVSEKMLLAVRESLSPEVYKRCEYVIAENQRVLDTCEALALSDLAGAGRMMFETHRGLRDLYQVSCPELDLLVRVASDTWGVLGSRMMGGGFGGCTLSLVQADAIPAFKKKTAMAFLEAFGRTPAFYDVHTSNGAGRIATT
jgi:galactokinase